MKEKLLRILQNDPATAGRPDDFLDSLADDIQAVIIRAISPGDPSDPVAEIESTVERVFESEFGTQLFHIVNTVEFPGKKRLYYSARKSVTKAAIQSILVEQEAFSERRELTVATPYSDDLPTDGRTLKRRLKDLHVAPTSTAIN